MKDHPKLSKTTVLIIAFCLMAGVITLGVFVMEVRNVTATVRIADSESEDELYMSDSSLTKRIKLKLPFHVNTAYTLRSAKVSDTQSVVFESCELSGIYDPVQCTDDEGISYWVTLTEIK